MPREEIEKIKMPKWLNANVFQFNLGDILYNSLYYPSAGLDGTPVKYFMGNIYSFVYVDYGYAQCDFNTEICRNEAFRGYKIIHKENILKYQLVNGAINYSKIQNDFKNTHKRECIRDFIKAPYCYWVIFERLDDFPPEYNPKRFSLLYLCSEAVSAYFALYVDNNIAPKILCIIQPGHGFGHNWTNFTDRTKHLAQAVFSMKKLPKYLINGGYYNGQDPDIPGFPYAEPIWPEYKEIILGHLYKPEESVK